MKLKFDTHGNLKQKECAKAWASKTIRNIVYGGAKGGAKSYTGVSLIFSDAFTYPNTHYFIARKSLTNIRKFTIPSINEVFEHWGITENYYKYNGQDNYYQLYNGSKVYLLDAKYLPSDPKYMRFGSMQMTRGWIEEAGEFEEECVNNLAASIGRWKNDVYDLPAKLLQTCNPAKNYLYRKYYKPNLIGNLTGDSIFIQALPQDNKRLPAGYIDNLLKDLSKNEVERLVYGNWEYDDDPSALIDYSSILNCFTNTFVEEGERYISVDMARLGGDKIVIIEWSGFRAKVTYQQKKTIDKSIVNIQASMLRNSTPISSVVIDDDGLGGGAVDMLKARPFVNNSVALPSPTAPYNDKGVRDKENFDNLKSQCYYKLAEKINKNEIYIECEDEIKDMIIEELEQVKQKELNSDMKKGVVSKKKVTENIGRSPDFSDALMMRMYFEYVPKLTFADAEY